MPNPLMVAIILPIALGASAVDGSRVSVRDTGAVGNATVDDTAAIQRALNTGRAVVCHTGDTYSVSGGLVSNVAGQLIDFTGCVVQLRDNATAKGILRLNGEGSSVMGGTWDLNAARAGADAEDGYGTWAVLLAANRTSAERLHVRNSNGIGIKGAAGISFAAVRHCRTEGTRVFAIYFDAAAGADAEGNRIEGNEVDFSSNGTGQGIGLYGRSDPAWGRFTHEQRHYFVQNNLVVGPSTGQGSRSVGITLRAVDGVVSGNVVRGGDIGISLDRTAPSRSVVTGNHVSGHKSIGIEVNGGNSAVTGNVIEGGTHGIEGSIGSSGRVGDSIDNTIVAANVLVGQSSAAIYFAPARGFTAQYVTITGNSIQPAGVGRGVYLQRDCRHAVIEGNVFRGPGSMVRGSRAVYLDGVNGDVAIRGNRFSGWERVVAAYSAEPAAQERLVFEENELSDIAATGAASPVSIEGHAAMGAGTRIQIERDGGTEGQAVFSGTIPPIPARSCSRDVDVTATGPLKSGAPCAVGMPSNFPPGLIAACFVAADDKVRLRVCNGTDHDVSPGQLSFSVRVLNP
jgi:hypothetical protein